MCKRRNTETPVDSGYSWIVLLATTGIYLIMSATAKSYVILYTEFLLYFGTGSGNTAWIGSVNAFLFFGMGPVSNRLAEMFSFRAVIVCGGILFSIGVFLSAFVPWMEMLYLTYGIVTGIGAGLVFVPTTTILNFYFEKRRALANSIMISGSGVGVFLFPFLYRYLIDTYGIKGALMVLSGIVANVCVGATLLRQPSQLQKKFQTRGNYSSVSSKHHDSKEAECSALQAERENNQQKNMNPEYEKIGDKCKTFAKNPENKKQNSLSRNEVSLSNFPDFSLFRNPAFAMYVMAFSSNTMAYLANYSAIAPKILDSGFSKDKVSIALAIAGLAEIISKLFFGWLLDLKLFKVKNLLIFTFIGGGVSTAIIPFFKNFIAYAVYAGILGVFPGSYFTFMAVALLQCIALTDLTRGFGLTTLFMSFGAVLSQPIAGWIEDATGSWDYSLWYIACLYFLSTILLLGEPFFHRYWCIQSKQTDGEKKAKKEMESDLEQSETQERRDSLELVSQAEIDYNTSL